MIRPVPEIVNRAVDAFDKQDESYDAAVRLVFNQWQSNTTAAEVLVKVVVLNRLYGTNIFAVQPVVQRILELKIDPRLEAGDPSLVDDLARIRFNDKTRNCFSFASKYCSWHAPEQFPMYDSYVDARLWAYQNAFKFAKFARNEMYIFQRYREILDEFREFFGLTAFSRREIDKFLWAEEDQHRRDSEQAKRAIAEKG